MRPRRALAAAALIIVPSSVWAAGEADMTHLMTRLVLQLGVVIVSARLLGVVFSRYLKQPRVLGELAAGMLIGPYALGGFRLPVLGGPLFPPLEGALPVSPELYGLATLASIVLLFLSGLETDLPTFLQYSVRASVVGLGGVIVSFAIGNVLAVLFLPGADSMISPTALFLGTLSTATSVGITARILSERRKMSSPEGVTILAGAVLDDVIGIILLAVVVGVTKVQGAGGAVEWSRIGMVALKAFGFWLALTFAGIVVAPTITRGLKWLRSYDVIAGTALGVALLLAGLSEMAGLAMIIGAYIAGLALSQTDMAHELRDRLQGVYQFIVPIFFCVMGMMVDFGALPAVFWFGLLYTAGAIAGKLIGCGVPSLFLGFNLRGALRIGAGMLPRGEVTLIVAGIGLSAGAIGSETFGVAIMTLLIASVVAPPLLVRSFAGGEGLRRKPSEPESAGDQTQISLSLASPRLAEFVRTRIQETFRQEEFFVYRVGGEHPIYQIRKENLSITLVQEQEQLTLTAAKVDEPLVRLMVLEAIAELKELVEGIQRLDSPEALGTDLVTGLLDEGDEDNG